uniref:Prostaglandin F2 receptor inhibitor n=1 Tax=Iconisemion striatum TaxID=60296 RepID=A0A1A7X1C4_9TELE
MVNCLPTLVLALSLVGGCSARVVTVSPGPLIRVEGQPVSIRCNVTDYGGPREQDFEWEMSRDATGAKTKIISTFDVKFSSPTLSSRIASGDISVVRLNDNEVELKIAELKSQDAGFYFCQTPSTDMIISGNYVAQVQLTVILNTLKVSPATLPKVIPEGSDLTLSCNVTREFSYPTYLSVTWSVKKGATSEDVLMFGPQGDVSTGSTYTYRYLDGGIRLVPSRNGVFDLVITRVTTSDDGIYQCTGAEWTHDRGGKWTKIVESKKEMGAVSVTPSGNSLDVKASSYSSPSSTSLLLSPGDSLTLFCNVSVDNMAALTLEVTWLADGREIITMERSGVVISNGTLSGAPGNHREANLEKTGVGEYRLGVKELTGEDGGLYRCRVRAFVKKEGLSAGGGGRWQMTAEKSSSPVTVKVSEIKPNFTPSLRATQKPSRTSEPIQLVCNVTDITRLPPGGRLAVSWEHVGLPGNDGPHHIGSLDGNGNVFPGRDYDDKLKKGLMSLSRNQPNAFKLWFLSAQPSDMGQYVCIVSSWSVSSQGDLAKTSENRSSPLTVQWDTKTPSLNVAAKRIREASVGGATFEMSCTVTTENLVGWTSYAVSIESQDDLKSNVRTVMSLNPDNEVQYGETDPNRRDNLVLTKSGPAEFRFRLAGVQLSDRGFYWCNVTAFTKQQLEQTWTRAAQSESNKVKIDFQENGPAFTIAIRSDASSVYPWETAKIDCSLSVSGSSPKTDDLAYEVSWFFTRLRGGQTTTRVATLDRFGIVRKIHRNSSSDVSIERRDTNNYQLNIYGTQDRDSGEYHCMATPWYLSASTGAWTEAGELMSGRVFISVKFAVWDSLKFPLLYGTAASLGVGLFSLLLGLLCAHCCCRNTTHTPRSHNKLMNFDMD